MVSLNRGSLNRGSLNLASVNRDSLKADNRSPVSNPAKGENRVSSLKTDNVSRGNRNRVNAASGALRGCQTTIQRAGLSSLKEARTARLRQSLARIF